MSLGRYNAKRNFAKTAEPRGKLAQKPGHRFVVQQHAARRMHYDFRLELDGVLKSWAVPKGPSFNPADKRLAVQTEDHPVAYATFEGIIPAGEYGGGKVIVWDEGTWEPLQDPRRGLKKGHLAFKLTGQKLKGAWHLLRMGGVESSNWLLCKVDDAHADVQGDITQDAPRSIYSDRLVAEVDGAGPRARKSSRTKPAAQRSPAPADSPLPPTIAPQLATLGTELPKGSGWLYEVKLDGYRLMATRSGDDVRLLTRSGHDWTHRLPTIREAVAQIPCTRWAIDGELVVLGPKGSSDFAGLQQALAAGESHQLLFCVFDLLLVGEQDLRPRPLLERKAALQKLLGALPAGSTLQYWPHVAGAAAGRRALAAARAQGLEGLMAKRADAPYQMRRSPDWMKLKCVQRQEFVVGGYRSQGAGAAGVRALLLGTYDPTGALRYAGKVGTGLSRVLMAQLVPALQARRTKRTPFAEVPQEADVVWVRPELVVEVRFAHWTAEGRLRHASLIALREDKPAVEVTREQPDKGPSEAPKPPRQRPQRPAALTHPERLLAPNAAVTKADLAAYMGAVAPYMLPYLADRPLSVLRCPKPDLKHNFFHKHLETQSPGLGQVTIDNKAYSYLKAASGLLALVQLSVLELHNWGCVAPDVEAVDTIVFDLDPGEGVPPAQTVAAATTIREVLRQLGLKSLLKATGGKGLHVVVPGVSGCSWPAAKAFGQLVADYVVAGDPAHFTASMSKSVRRGKVFIDYFRNGRGNTAIAVYSPRARPGLPIARPLRWSELTEKVLLTPWDVPTLLAKIGRGYSDPWLRERRLKQPMAQDILKEAMKHATGRGST